MKATTRSSPRVAPSGPGAVAPLPGREVPVDEGRVERVSLGFRLRSLKGTVFSNGVLVNAVERGSPPEKAGLQAGDRILSLGDRHRHGDPFAGGQPIGLDHHWNAEPFERRARLRHRLDAFIIGSRDAVCFAQVFSKALGTL